MKKLHELSFLNVLFCLIVVFIHVSSEPVSALLKESFSYKLIFVPWRLSAFVVQGFIFLSGLKMFLNTKPTFSYKRYYISRAKKIVIPYVIFVCIFYMYFLKNAYFGFSFKDLASYMLKGDLVSHFYFVIVIVQFYALRPLWQLMIDKISPAAAMSGAMLLTVIFGQYFPDMISFLFNGYQFSYNDRLFTTYLFYWVMGCYAGAHYKSFCEKIKSKGMFISALFLLFAFLNGILSYTRFAKGIELVWLEDIHIAYSVFAILFCCYAALCLADKVMRLRSIKLIDKSSYYIYLIHPLFIFIINGVFHHMGVTDIGVKFILRTIVVYLCSFLLCEAYSVIRDKLKKRS